MIAATLRSIQASLEAAAEPSFRAWSEAYLKHVIAYRGVRVPHIRQAVKLTLSQTEPALNSSALCELAHELLSQHHSEDKMAGILVLAEHCPVDVLRTPATLARLAAHFDDGRICNWSTCDWLCVKVLGRAARGDETSARLIAGWREASNLWRRRASCVAFVDLAADGEANFAGFTDLVVGSCEALIVDGERFAQTGAAWTMRMIGQADRARLVRFLDAHRHCMSAEAIASACEKLPQSERAKYVVRNKRRGREQDDAGDDASARKKPRRK